MLLSLQCIVLYLSDNDLLPDQAGGSPPWQRGEVTRGCPWSGSTRRSPSWSTYYSGQTPILVLFR